MTGGVKTAIVHEWLNEWAGSEQCLAAILEIFPDADLFAVVDFLDDSERAKLGGRRAKTTFVQRLPWARRKLELYLPLMPLAIEQFDLSGYDRIISSSHAVAKGVITGPGQLHLSYVHSPMRYAWDLQHEYLRLGRLDRGLRSAMARMVFHYLRLWDVRTTHGVDRYACNSVFVARRIRKCYGREALVIYPPVDLARIPFVDRKQDFYLAASRLMPYKRVDLIVEAFRALPERRLIVIGAGPELERLRRSASPNVSFLGRATDAILHDHLGRARAFVFAAQEDFGILPVEAQACGTPVIAFGKGGARETVRGIDGDRPTGIFFDEQTPESLIDAIKRFEAQSPAIKSSDCRENAMRFNLPRFREEFRAWVDAATTAWLSEQEQA
jgi:glycosyltransferase involved in cell wall biosynthesis